jgi:hypothetical protein
MEITPIYGLLKVKKTRQVGIRTVAVAMNIATTKDFGFAA